MALGWPIERVNVIDSDLVLNDHTDGQIACILNEHVRVSGEGKSFHGIMVRRLRQRYRLKSRYDRLRERGMLTLTETAAALDTPTQTVKVWLTSSNKPGEIS